MNTFTTVFSMLVALFFAVLAFHLSRRVYEKERENTILWDQLNRHEEYISQRVAEDEQMARAAVLN